MKRLVGFGDSITFGHGLDSVEENYLYRLCRRSGYEMVNSGVGGHTTEDALSRIQTDLLDLKPDVAIIEFGMNDHVCYGVDEPKVDREIYKTNLNSIIDKVRACGCDTIILCTIHPVVLHEYYTRHPRSFYQNPSGADGYIDDYSLAVQETVSAKKVSVADINQQFKNYVNAGGKLSDLLLQDGVHPNGAGHEQYYRCIARAMNKLINS